MKILLTILFIFLINIPRAYAPKCPDEGRTMLADGGIITIIGSDGTVKSCTQMGSGTTSVLICN